MLKTKFTHMYEVSWIRDNINCKIMHIYCGEVIFSRIWLDSRYDSLTFIKEKRKINNSNLKTITSIKRKMRLVGWNIWMTGNWQAVSVRKDHRFTK